MRKPEGRRLAQSEFGIRLEDLEGAICRDISFWSIDESGNPGRTDKTLGKFITYTGMTELSPLDYDEIFRNIPREANPDGSSEVHYSYLLENDCNSLYTLAARIRESDLLLVSSPMEKKTVNQILRQFKPRNAGYVIMGLYRLIEAIKFIDHSELIVATFDKLMTSQRSSFR